MNYSSIILLTLLFIVLVMVIAILSIVISKLSHQVDNYKIHIVEKNSAMNDSVNKLIDKMVCKHNQVNNKMDVITNSDIAIHPHTRPTYNNYDEYQQVGHLASINDSYNRKLILPLLGRKINRDRWEYYTSTENNSRIRIDITYKNRECADDVGCDEIQNNDIITVPSYDCDFQVHMYRLKPIRYNTL